MYITMEEIMKVETPPAAGELDFAANKEAYERYFINVAGILASNNEFICVTSALLPSSLPIAMWPSDLWSILCRSRLLGRFQNQV